MEYSGVVKNQDWAIAERIKYLADKQYSFYTIELGTRNAKDEMLYIDARTSKCKARLISHSCDPNCIIVEWLVEGLPRLLVFAKNDIFIGEELTLDYGTKATGLLDGELCLCGTTKCRLYF